MIVMIVLMIFGGGMACEQLPCRPPDIPPVTMPDLVSPTPIDRDISRFDPPTPVPTITLPPTAILTLTPMPTWTPFLDTDPIGDSVATVEGLLNATAIPVYNELGTPVGWQDISIATNAVSFFGYVRGVGTGLGPFEPLVTFMVAAIGITLTITLATWVIPIVVAAFGFIRKLVQIVLDFIPF